MSSAVETVNLDFLRSSDLERVRSEVSKNPKAMRVFANRLREHIASIVATQGEPAGSNETAYDDLYVTLAKLANAGLMRPSGSGVYVIRVNRADATQKIALGDFEIELKRTVAPKVAARRRSALKMYELRKKKRLERLGGSKPKIGKKRA